MRVAHRRLTDRARESGATDRDGDLADRLKLLSRAQRWEEMPQHIDDDVLHTFVTIATYDTIARKLCDRYGDVVTNCEFSIAVHDDADRAALAGMIADLHAAGTRG